MPITADTKPGGEEDCKVCKKGKQSTAAFGALLAQRGMSIPGAGTDKQTGGKASPVTECLSHTSSSAGVGCPADSEGLGRAGWTVLHTMAAYFPAQPSYSQQAGMSVFLRLFASFYPCRHCAEDFQDYIRKSPPATESRGALSVWMCEAHNDVNTKLGKPTFLCTQEAIEKRWKENPLCD